MKNLIIEGTNSTPAVIFNTDGKLRIEGRSLPENTSDFYKPLIDWASNSEASEIKLEIKLVYLNSGSIKKLLELLKVFDSNLNIKSFHIDWHFEQDDDDIRENANVIEGILKRARFRYYEIPITA